MRNIHQYARKWTYKGHNIIDCETCGFIHLYPFPTRNELNDFYGARYWREVKQYDSGNIEVHKKAALNNTSFIKIYDSVEKYVKKSENETGTMMDVGCGPSLMQYYFKEKGWNTLFLEPNRDAYDFLIKCGFKGYNATFENFSLNEDIQFDFVNISFVLEHVINPFAVLQKISRLAKKGGILRITVPNDFSRAHIAYIEGMNGEPCWVAYPDHINYFNYESLTKLLNQFNFKEIYRTTIFPLDLLLAAGFDFYRDENKRKKVGSIISDFTNSFIRSGQEDALRLFYEHIALAGFGRSIELYLESVNKAGDL